jgi:hypothetical protein
MSRKLETYNLHVVSRVAIRESIGTLIEHVKLARNIL